MRSDRQTIPIAGIRDENDAIRSFFFNAEIQAEPGQFIMLTIFGQGEKPFSIMEVTDTSFGLTIKKLGPLTEKLFELKEGDLVSFRGPYGTSFTQETGRILMVGGGFATPPLRFLAKLERQRDVNYVVNINGARTASDLLYVDEFQDFCDRSLVATDDGSAGFHGTSVDLMSEVLEEDKFDRIYISGPEKMMKAAVSVAEKYDTPYEVNLERYMKCGVGVCGSCVMDPNGVILCMEGPIIQDKVLQTIDDFGSAHRDKTGRVVPI